MEFDLAIPPAQTFDSYENLEAAVQEFAKAHGYAVVVGRSHRNRKGEMKTKILNCAKGGKVRDRVVDRWKPLISQKTQCPFQCKAELDSTGWVLTISNSHHNHEAVDPIAFY